MCRKLIVTNELFLGSRQLGYELYSLPKGEVVEFTEKQLRDCIIHGKDEGYGVIISEDTGELIPDEQGFYCRNWMIKRYGFVYVNRDNDDLKDMKRIKKKSFEWYKNVISSNGEVL